MRLEEVEGMRSSVSVWATDIYYDWLPPVCWRTGRPADERLPVTFRSYPRWTGLLILAGIVPFLIGRFLAGTAVHGILPIERHALHELRSRLRTPYALLAMFVVLLLIAVTTQSLPLLAASLAFLVATPVVSAAINLGTMVRGRVVVADGVPDRFVVLRNVHPAFAEAVRRQYDERTARARNLPLQPSIYALNVGPPQER